MLRLIEFLEALLNMFSCQSETIHLKKCKINIALKFFDVFKLSEDTKKEMEFQSICKHDNKVYVSNLEGSGIPKYIKHDHKVYVSN